MDLQGRLPAATRRPAGGPAGRRHAMAALAALVMLAAGCNGGDDLSLDGGLDDQEPINRGNALEVARLVVGRGMDSLALVDLVGQGLVEPVLDPVLAGEFVGGLPEFECDNGQDGTVSVTLSDRDGDDRVSEQDTASLNYTNCRELLLERTLDGATPPDAAVVAVLEGDENSTVPVPPWTIGVDVEMNGLTLTDQDGDAALMSGLLSANQSSDDGLLIVRQANTIRFSFDNGSVVDTLRNVQTRFEEDNRLNQQGFRAEMRGEVFSTGLDGSFAFETLTPLSGPLNQVPVSGVLRVEGDRGTSMEIRALQNAASEAQLVVDEDGDGDFDFNDPEPIPVSWRELDFL